MPPRASEPNPRRRKIDPQAIYDGAIRPDMLGPAPRAGNPPRRILVLAAPGAGATGAALRLRLQCAQPDAMAVIGGFDLARYAVHAGGEIAQAAATLAESWTAQLVNDALGLDVDFIWVRETPVPPALLASLAAAGGLEVVMVASDADRSRQGWLARFEHALTMGIALPVPDSGDHDRAYAALPATAATIEADRLAERVSIVTPDGRALYANEVDASGQWVDNPGAPAALTQYRERRPPSHELADTALRWQTLQVRLTANAQVPRALVARAMGWAKDCLDRAMRDAEAARRVEAGRVAAAFRTLPEWLFAQEFPQYAHANERMVSAAQYAESNFEDAAERAAFVQIARGRLADRIAEGKLGAVPEVPATTPAQAKPPKPAKAAAAARPAAAKRKAR